MKHGKKYTDAAKLIESSKTYDPSEALELCCKTAPAEEEKTEFDVILADVAPTRCRSSRPLRS